MSVIVETILEESAAFFAIVLSIVCVQTFDKSPKACAMDDKSVPGPTLPYEWAIWNYSMKLFMVLHCTSGLNHSSCVGTSGT